MEEQQEATEKVGQEERVEMPAGQPLISPGEVPVEVQEEPKQIAQPGMQPTQVFIPKKTSVAEAGPSRLQKFRDFFTECLRVLRVTKKPDRVEFTTIVKVAGIGMAVIGFLGFFVHFVKELVF